MQKESLKLKLGRFLFLFCFMNLIGLVSYVYMTPETKLWYQGLPQSSLTPPDSYFGIVWTILFFLMSLSGTIAWGKVPMGWFKSQILFIFLWSFLFFLLRSPLLAFYGLIALIFCECKTIRLFYLHSKMAAYLLIPLLLWSFFALYLNLYIILG